MCVLVCERVCMFLSVPLNWRAACESVTGEVFHTLPTDAPSWINSTVNLSRLWDQPDGSHTDIQHLNPVHNIINWCVTKFPPHTHTHICERCSTRWTFRLDLPFHFLFPSKLAWGCRVFVYHTYFGWQDAECSINKTTLIIVSMTHKTNPVGFFCRFEV